MNTILSTLTASLLNLYDAFTTLGRLLALQSLTKKQLEEKNAIITEATQYIFMAHQIAQFLKQSYAIKVHAISWHENTHPVNNLILDSDGKTHDTNLQQLIKSLLAASNSTLDAMISKTERIIHLMPIFYFLMQLKKNIPYQRHSTLSIDEILGTAITISTNKKTLNGPPHIEADSIFLPTQNILEKDITSHTDSISEAAPYYWGLAARESVIADLCCLSIIEYDGFSINFYSDIIKQAWDKIRHAMYFLNIAVNLISELKQQLSPNDILSTYLTQFEETGQGLPIPLEKNLYEAMWNVTIEERLILLNHDTETSEIGHIKEKIFSPCASNHPQMRDGLEVVIHEEITHSRSSKKWLKYLLPNIKDRHDAINKALSLKNILLLPSRTHYQEEPLNKLIIDTLWRHK